VLNHNADLAKLQKQMKSLVDDSDEMCDMMKIIFFNAEMDVKMTQSQKKQTMATHIKKSDCDKCLYYTTYINKDFFKE